MGNTHIFRSTRKTFNINVAAAAPPNSRKKNSRPFLSEGRLQGFY
jgi:hypothetical protein